MQLIPVKHLTTVLSQYVQFYTQYGDIIKVFLFALYTFSLLLLQAALGEIRDSDRTMCGRVMLMCLVENMEKVEGAITVDQVNEEKELARRLAMMLGLDGTKNRDAIIFIHKEGIKIAFRNGQEMTKLLLVLAEFSTKVLKQDKQKVLKYFMKEVKKVNGEEREEVEIYRNSLQGEVREDAVEQE